MKRYALTLLAGLALALFSGCATPDGGIAMPFSAMVQSKAHHTAMSRGYYQPEHTRSLYVHPRSVSSYEANGMRVYGSESVHAVTLPELAWTLHPTLTRLAWIGDFAVGTAGVVGTAAAVNELVESIGDDKDDRSVTQNVSGNGNVVQNQPGSGSRPSANSNEGDSNQDSESAVNGL